MCSWPSDTTYILRAIKLDSITDHGGPCVVDVARLMDSGRICRSAALPREAHYKFYIESINELGNVTSTSTRIGMNVTIMLCMHCKGLS